MHLLSWNTNHWLRRHLHAELWDYLDGLNPDIALLQEAYPPKVNTEDVVMKNAGVKLSNSGNYVWHEIEGKRGLNRYIVLAGDFNASPQFDAKQPGFSHKILFDRIANFGLVDLFPYMPENPLQTWRSDKTDIPWQLDHCFVSKNLFNKVEKAEVLYNETIEKLSDHNPLLIKLNIT